KAAPMLDIHAALKDLKNVAEVHVVSLKNECKELLFMLEDNQQGEVMIRCVLLTADQSKIISFSLDEEKNAEATFGPLLTYLYEPDAALLKAGMFKLLSQRYPIDKLHPHSHLYTS